MLIRCVTISLLIVIVSLIKLKLNIFIIILFLIVEIGYETLPSSPLSSIQNYASKLDMTTSIFPIVAHHCLLDCIGQLSSKITTCELRKLLFRVAAQTKCEIDSESLSSHIKIPDQFMQSLQSNPVSKNSNFNIKKGF